MTTDWLAVAIANTPDPLLDCVALFYLLCNPSLGFSGLVVCVSASDGLEKTVSQSDL